MTRLAILADIHGNLPALEVVIDHLAHFNPDMVLVAGDIINWGPFSRPVLERIAQLPNWRVIRGNAEYYLLEYNTPRAPAAWQQYNLLPWLSNQLRGYWQTRIATWPDTLTLRFPDAPPITLWHGLPNNPWQTLYQTSSPTEVDSALISFTEQIYVSAHSHLPFSRPHTFGQQHPRAGQTVTLLNPGTVGVPLMGQPTATYLTLEAINGAWQPTFHQLPIDLQPIFDEFERTEFIAQYGYAARLVIEEFRTQRLQILPFRRWAASQNITDPTLTDVDTFLTTVDPLLYTPEPYQPYAPTTKNGNFG